MHVPDLTPLNGFTAEATTRLIAVGWLEPDHDYAKGEVNEHFVTKLAELAVDPWQPGIAMGRYSCDFCRFSGGPTTFRLERAESSAVKIGSSNLWIPAEGFLFVAPSMILHYIDAHDYAPPEEFQQAVMACPPMRSMAYLRAILENGPKELGRGGGGP